ncbi:tRNA (guanosine(46)-N7)-methyltransferase TrmB, partial [candidate division KSB1 bacterium]|nr:tRNA (guanosine(46)-N7)-methyltransferase TrmB [candidate division KSB1 bacterium]
GMIHLKTDDLDLFKFSLKAVQAEGGVIHEALPDLYQVPDGGESTAIQTTYERRYLTAGRTIKYLRFSL